MRAEQFAQTVLDPRPSGLAVIVTVPVIVGMAMVLVGMAMAVVGVVGVIAVVGMMVVGMGVGVLPRVANR